MTDQSRRRFRLGVVGALSIATATAFAGPRDFPDFGEVTKEYSKVTSTLNGSSGMYTLYTRSKDGQILAELPRNFGSKRYFFAMTTAAGDAWAGLQGGDRYVYWKRYDKRLALIAPNIAVRSSGDRESKDSVARHFTDRVLLDIPIVTMGPGGGPVIDLDNLLLGNATTFFGGQGRGINGRLASIKKAKAFPENIEVCWEVPINGVLKSLHYSISEIPNNTGYKPRAADNRVGYFTTYYKDLGKFDPQGKYIRYINRWKLEKADPKLKMSPPKEPIIFYLEHTVPVRYRRWVREGVLYWNEAFEQVGILDAVEVRIQDKATGAHMDKDPEDVRYNFIRWLSNDISTAVGPSRVHPLTGQILDADIVLTDGWIRTFYYQANDLLPQFALEGMGPETLEWLEQHPDWDPRIRFAPPGERERMLHERKAKQARMGVLAYGGHPAANADPTLFGDDEYDGLVGRTSQFNGYCMAATGKAYDMAVARLNMQILSKLKLEEGGEPGSGGEEGEEGEGESNEPKEPVDILDGIPDYFIGPVLADLVAHEVGHTLGLRHNFKASAVNTLEEMNSEEMVGEDVWTASVMDYHPILIRMDEGEVQGDYAPIGIGKYDMWAIEYGYTFGKAEEVAKRSAHEDLPYATDEDTWGPDPLARRYDLSKNPLDYANNIMKLARFHREKLLTDFVEDGESWAQVRRGYVITLGEQTKSLSMMANWIGGAHVYRAKKGDPGATEPIKPVDAQMQRDALQFIIDNAFQDDSFGVTPELLRHMTVEKWYDDGSAMQEPTWNVHDVLLGVQSSALTMLMNPTTMRRVYDNEFFVDAGEDAMTIPEYMNTITEAIWTELNARASGKASDREPMVSSLRRNLQREHVERLIDLGGSNGIRGAAGKPVSNIALHELRKIRTNLGKWLNGSTGDKLDAYTVAHFEELDLRIAKVLDAMYIYNTDEMGGGAGGGGMFIFSTPE